MKYHVLRRTCRFTTFPPLLLFYLMLLFLICPGVVSAEELLSPDNHAATQVDQQSWQMLATINELLLPAGNISQAREATLLLQATPMSADAQAYTHYLLALAACYEDDYATALVEYQAMGASASDSVAILLGGMEGEITTLMLTGDYPQAMDAATALIDVVAPSDAPQAEEYRAGACYQIGEMLYRQGKYPEALSQFRTLLTNHAQTSWCKAAQAKIDEITTALNGGTQ
jgi:tetratricopeptide (TPR) repeat protein